MKRIRLFFGKHLFGETTKMKKLQRNVFSLVFFVFLFIAGPASSQERILPYWDKVIDAATINGTGEVCSAPVSVYRTQYLSAQWNAMSATGTANVRIYVMGSIDGINFVIPDNVADLSVSDTSEAWKISSIYLPMIREIKVCVKGVAANPADTVASVWLGRQ